MLANETPAPCLASINFCHLSHLKPRFCIGKGGTRKIHLSRGSTLRIHTLTLSQLMSLSRVT